MTDEQCEIYENYKPEEAFLDEDTLRMCLEIQINNLSRRYKKQNDQSNPDWMRKEFLTSLKYTLNSIKNTCEELKRIDAYNFDIQEKLILACLDTDMAEEILNQDNIDLQELLIYNMDKVK